MTQDQLEALLEGGEETPSLDFKAPIAWDVRTFVKDILAMANTIDGGRIVIGVQDDLRRVGMTDEQAATYSLDVMKDQVNAFADPHVVFRRHRLNDRAGLQYVVIEVDTFEEIPVICCQNRYDVHAGEIYYRTRAGRAQSSRIGSSADMRDLIELAIARRSRRLRDIGLIQPPEPYNFGQELGPLNE